MTLPAHRPKKRGPGRPRKDSLPAATTKAQQKAVMDSYKDRIIRSSKNEHIVKELYRIALEDGHPHQMVAMKMLTDRFIPVKAFEEDGKAKMPSISINISGIGQPQIDSIDGEVIEDDE